jgi:hypothetical protein
MVRKQIYIPRRQDVLIKRLSQTKGVSEAEIIRQAIEREISRELSYSTADQQKAWDELMEFLEERKNEAGTGEPVHWNREEIYVEREDRWLKKEQS